MNEKWVIDNFKELEKSCFIHPYSFSIIESIIKNSNYLLFFLTENSEKKDSIFVYNYNGGLHILWGDWNQGNVIGYSIFFINSLEKSAELMRIGIHPFWRNQKKGYFLLEKVILYLFSNRGIDVIFLEVSEKNINAITLYKKLKFKIFATRKNYYGKNENAICMKLLKPI